MENFGSYLRRIRKARGLSLKQVETSAEVSNAYISQIETGRRRPPHPDILKKLAKVYEVPLKDLLVKAGYFDDESDKRSTKEQINSAFDHVTSDPRLSYGTRLKGSKLGTDGKRLIIELYEKWAKERLLGEKGP
jgi:transcriptional regulator with XRE-family HTH domain